MQRYVYLAAVALLSASALALLWWSDVPLGVPGEWTWHRIGYPQAGSLAGAVIGPAVALAAAALYAALGWSIRRGISRSRRIAVAARLLILVCASFGLLLVVGSAPPAGHDLARMPVVLYDPGASGYFTIARYGDDGEPLDAREFLSSYEQRMRGGDVLHIGTHPPGLILVHRGLIELCRRSPALREAIHAVTPADVEAVLDILNRRARIGPVLDDADRAALWLAVLLVHAVAAATVVPLYLLMRRYRSRAESWGTACLWPLVPALAVFLPKSDAIFPFLGTLFLWLWLEGCARGSVVRSAAAGLVLWLGSSFSLAMLPVAALGGFLAIWEWRTMPVIGSPSSASRRLLLGVVCGAAGFLVPIAALWLASDLNLINVWIWNYRNHAGFYGEYPRTWWKWLLVNPVELGLAAGAPLVVAALVGAWRSLRAPAGHGEPGAVANPRFSGLRLFQLGPVIGCLGVWSMVWLWGKNMGEAARLWLVFQPWLVWMASGAFGRSGSDVTQRDDSSTLWAWTIGWQAIVCVATVTRVSGFHYLNPDPADGPAAVSAAASE